MASYTQRHATGTDGVGISIRDHGSPTKPAIVFIHGYCCSQLVFSRQIESDLVSKYRLVTYDLRGHGESDKPEDLEKYSDNALWSNDLQTVMDSLRLESAVLVGWSTGGRVAANYLHTHGSKRIRGVNFVSTPALADPKRPHRGPDGSASEETLAPVREQFIKGTARFVRACTAVATVGDDFDLLFGAAMSVPMAARQGSFRWHIDYGDAMRTHRIPILATHGRADRLILPVAAEAISARMEQVEVSLYPDAGHMPFWEAPSRFNRELDAFAARCFEIGRAV